MDILEKLRGVRHIKWLAVILAAGIALLAFTRGTPGDPAEVATQTPLEARLERVLGTVEGAGKVSVMVNQKERGQGVFAQPGMFSQSGVFSQSGGREDVAGGVIVVAQGADDLRVAMALVRAVCALLGVDAESVEVLKMREGMP